MNKVSEYCCCNKCATALSHNCFFLFFFSFFLATCSRLSWFPASFWAHIKIAVSYRIGFYVKHISISRLMSSSPDIRLLCPRPRALSDDAVWRLSVWRLSHTSGRRAACAAGRLDGAYWLIGPDSAGLAQGCRCALPLQTWAGAFRGGCPLTAC